MYLRKRAIRSGKAHPKYILVGAIGAVWFFLCSISFSEIGLPFRSDFFSAVLLGGEGDSPHLVYSDANVVPITGGSIKTIYESHLDRPGVFEFDLDVAHPTRNLTLEIYGHNSHTMSAEVIGPAGLSEVKTLDQGAISWAPCEFSDLEDLAKADLI